MGDKVAIAIGLLMGIFAAAWMTFFPALGVLWLVGVLH